MLLTGDFVFFHQRTVAGLFGRGVRRIRLRLCEIGQGGFDLLPFGQQTRLGASDVQVRRGNAGPLAKLCDGDVRVLRVDVGLGLAEIALLLRERDLIVSGIQFDGQLAALHTLIVLDVNGRNRAGNAARDGVHVAIDLGIVDGFVSLQVRPKKPPTYHKRDKQNKGGQGGDGVRFYPNGRAL